MSLESSHSYCGKKGIAQKGSFSFRKSLQVVNFELQAFPRKEIKEILTGIWLWKRNAVEKNMNFGIRQPSFSCVKQSCLIF